ncbi:carbonic anhydrase [Bacillus sp. BRMEA1]|uniref:carbonic anhydrase n=1 Tax=Neobacillus endophyticus TaxID=2738405 RepID=UPI00156539CF|nr:carbonic anhydrase [Neobacillus endophyticus]NRD76231.1 carbonic anhydrase [Neobacillus endophyticus]
MKTAKKKKVLLVIGNEDKIEDIKKEFPSIDFENMIILQSYGSVISPFGDQMRDIILTVYQENVEEIIVTISKANKMNTDETIKKILENEELQEKLKTYHYLFTYCIPEFPEGGIKSWLEGSNPLKDDLQKSVEVIRQHPLLPSTVKVRSLLYSFESKKEVDFAVL